MSLNAHLLPDYAPEIVQHLRAQLDPAIDLAIGDVVEAGSDCHILVAGRPDRQTLSTHPELHTLIIPWIGVPPETRDLLFEFPHIAVHNIHHNAVPVAEMSIALLLAAAKLIVPFDRALREGDWRPRYQVPAPALQLHGRTILILGYGAIGRRVAQICEAMGMRVLAVKRTVNSVDTAAKHSLFPAQKLDDLLPEAEGLIITLPLTPETNGLIGAEQLARTPARSILVNVGRGPIVDQQALYHALASGIVGAAGLDVWYHTPSDVESRSRTLPADYPFWQLDNVVLSPHRAGLTSDIDYLRMDHLAQLLNASARNEPVPNRIDLVAGY